MKEIKITDIENIKIGNAENFEGGTGCTVVICEKGACAGLDVRGGGPASRETELLKPLANAKFIHAILLGGGSAYGLDAAGGVMQYLEEHGIGLPVGKDVLVPLVCQSDIFDLGVGSSKIRPNQAMGYQACVNAGNYQDGCFGAGTGATVGKLAGMAQSMKSGVGSYAIQMGDLKIGAVVVCNAVGNIYDWKNGQEVAGVLNPDGKTFAANPMTVTPTEMATNTTIGVIVTNAKFDKSELCKIAGMSHNGYARSIRPVHTSMDGDSIYAMSVGEVESNVDLVGTLAAEVMSEAILNAVKSAKGMYGLKAYNDIQK